MKEPQGQCSREKADGVLNNLIERQTRKLLALEVLKKFIAGDELSGEDEELLLSSCDQLENIHPPGIYFVIFGCGSKSLKGGQP